jgi:hypothetical protein
MFNDKSFKYLLIGLGILIVLSAFLFWADQKKEKTFKSELTNIDTSEVTKIVIKPKGEKKEINLVKINGMWNVEAGENYFAPAENSRIKNIAANFANLKTKRLAAKTSNKWKDFEVDDSLGTRVKLYKDKKLLADIVVGKFTFEQPRSFYSYARLYDDDETYIVDGYLDVVYNKSPSDYRNFYLISESYFNWKKLEFIYPSDSSFVLKKENNKYFLNDQPADSAKSATALSGMGYATSRNFYDEMDPKKIQELEKTYQLKITKEDEKQIEIIAYKKKDGGFVINSSINPGTYFNADNELMRKFFKSKKDFLK